MFENHGGMLAKTYLKAQILPDSFELSKYNEI